MNTLVLVIKQFPISDDEPSKAIILTKPVNETDITGEVNKDELKELLYIIKDIDEMLDDTTLMDDLKRTPISQMKLTSLASVITISRFLQNIKNSDFSTMGYLVDALSIIMGIHLLTRDLSEYEYKVFILNDDNYSKLVKRKYQPVEEFIESVDEVIFVHL